ncbi:MAG TPA: LysO family transporter [Spirochaetota bacterium]|nr:LysO family transporter [Spirochaetota bacterium]
MTEILILMSAGIFIGFLVRGRQRLIFIIEKTTGFSIYILLFLLGISVGTNEKVISSFGRIGFNAIIIALSSVAGSILLSFILYKFLFSRDDY